MKENDSTIGPESSFFSENPSVDQSKSVDSRFNLSSTETETLDGSLFPVFSVEEISSLFEQSFLSFGFQKRNFNILQPSQLFLKKFGDQMRSKIYTFSDEKDREISLRPEMTSPCIAQLLEEFVESSELSQISQILEELPLKLYYRGRVFRKEWKKEKNSREFTQMGAEILGAKGVFHDAENILLALNCLEKLPAQKYRITVSHLGILTHLVQNMDLDSSFKHFFLENLRHRGYDFVESALKKESDFFPQSDSQRELSNILKKLTAEEERFLLSRLIHLTQPQIFEESQEPKEIEEIIEGLLNKIKRQNQYPMIQRILSFSQRLQNISGPPSEALLEAEKLLEKEKIDPIYIQELKELCKILTKQLGSDQEILIDFSMDRKLEYYTGIVFEIELQGQVICGGGRYDDLIEILFTHTKLAGCGFSFAMESLAKLVHKTFSKKESIFSLFFSQKDQRDLILAYVQSLRNRGHSIYLEEFPSFQDMEKKIQKLKKKISRLAWIHPKGYVEFIEDEIDDEKDDSKSIKKLELEEFFTQYFPELFGKNS